MVRRRFAERLAHELLDKQGIRGPKVDPYSIARRLGAIVVEKDVGDGKSGLVARSADRVAIGVNAAEAPVRRRFTVAHEVGHMLLHANEPLIVDEFGYALIGERRNETSPREVEANAFAAALLMPAAWIRRDLKDGIGIDVAGANAEGLSKFAERYGVSQQAMMYRLIHLGYLRNF